MPPRSAFSEKQIVVRRFMDILAAGGIPLHPQSGHRYIKWNAFPDNVWDRGVYVRLPRELIFDNPNQTPEERITNSLHAPWSEDNVEIARAAMDAGEIKVLTRPAGRNVVFECFDQNGTAVDVGKWSKLELNTSRRIKRLKIRQIKEGVSDLGSSLGTDESDDDTEATETASEDEQAQGPQLREITDFLRQLYLSANLGFSNARVAWKELPRLLARRKLYMTGLPADCAPNIIDDEVDPLTTPASWNNEKCDKFLAAAHSGNIKLVRRDTNLLILFQLANDDGSITNTLLQYSPSWIQKNMQASIMNNPTLFQRQRRNPRETESHSRVPPGATVKSSGRGWVVVEESTDEDDDGTLADDPKEQRKQLRLRVSAQVQRQIVDFNIRGDGTEVVWNTLPIALANSNKYLSGIPVGGLPKIKDDKVIFQASHPSLWNGGVIEQMQTNIEAGKFQVHHRPPGRIVLFEVEDGDQKYDSTLGYSQEWLAINIPDPSLALQRTEALARAEQKKAKVAAATAHVYPSTKDKEEKKKSDKAFLMRRNSTPSNTTRIKKVDENAKKKEEQERARANATAFAKQRFAEAAMGSRPSKVSYSFDSGRKLSINSGASTPHSEPSGSSSQLGPQPQISATYSAESFTPAVHPRQAFKGKQRMSNTNGSGNYQHLTTSRPLEDQKRTQEWSFSSATTAPVGNYLPWSPGGSSLEPIQTPTVSTTFHPARSWPPPGYPHPQWSESKMEEFHSLLARFFDRHALGTKVGGIPWRTLPQMLAERRQYLCGVPFVCIPLIEDDRVSQTSHISNWTAEMCGAMHWSLSEKHLNIKPREPGRRVLFEVIGPDGTFVDTTLGYSDRWVDTFLPDTVSHANGNLHRISTPLSPVLSLKRGRDGITKSTSPEETDAERDIKRRKPNDEDRDETKGVNGNPDPAVVRPKTIRPFKMAFNNSDKASNANQDMREEVINPRDLGLDRLVPGSLPPPLRKGRVFLRFADPATGKEEEVWEWIPPSDQGPTFSLLNSTIWNPTQAKWRITATSRSLSHLEAWETKEKADWPTKVDGNILGRGRCEFEEDRSQWEMHFDNKNAEFPWIICWDEDFARWEWKLLQVSSGGMDKPTQTIS
ncbi:hypothetical protein M408DRAFT_332417 [Serendipita vermifera MAFF 305830]|uniref:Uncharacterized protein n=1 Tax=Serendipita vermifera MAFF 305830 TaxID=933852 RepID=A0A0C3AF93_SERVB|nr:hypothetical protein M408DRAFT_332417 [Serendipita vermifera MAFF 305830]